MPDSKAYPAVHGDVLVLEDDCDLAPLLKDVLIMAGYDVYLARTVAEARTLLGTRSMVAAVLDWTVPGGSAEELADELKASRIPYVFASASVPSDLPKGHRWAPFFAKPFAITALINALEEGRSNGVPEAEA
jgi:DNA-binding response OmpR family regulator